MPAVERPPTPTPTAAATEADPQAFVCPTAAAAGSLSSALAGGAVSSGDAVRRSVARPFATPPATARALLAVGYRLPALAANTQAIEGRERSLGAGFVRAFAFPRQNLALRIVSVPAANLAQTEAALRAQPGVVSAGITGQRRFRTTSAAVYTDDPYFQGFAPNFELLPYAESAAVPGQWDMHAIGLEHAFGYSTATANTSPAGANAAALGSAAIKIAIIDTGEDAGHPELAGKIAYQHCFITDSTTGTQSTGSFSTDEDGHGTDVSGIAGAASGNGFGFTGAGGNSVLYAYRVFPTPDDNCANSNSSDAQCQTDTQDIASAIMDAVTQGVDVISMSLGGGTCSSGGVDADPVEGAAVTEALAANIIVVAASGNAGGLGVDSPACDTGVIAVGATGLADGAPTGTTSYTQPNAAAATAASVVEYVASYSQYGGAAIPHSASAWGIVAPGGDPGSADSDDLHWIENVWTTTPYQSTAGDTSFSGTCTNDYPSALSAMPDCRTLIAGTSMATPHVAGAAALILAVSGKTYHSSALMKTLLCQTADDLRDTNEGCGRLNVYRAMATALADPQLP